MNDESNQKMTIRSHSHVTDLQMRILFLQRKVKADRLNVPDELISHLAHLKATNPHEVEVSLMRVIAYSSIVREDPSVGLAIKALQPPLSATVITPSQIEPSVQKTRGKSIFAGLLQGFSLAIGGTFVMLPVCAFIDLSSHWMRIFTLSVPWLWWTIMVLNALTILIPVDLYRFMRTKSTSTLQSRVRVHSLLVAESIFIVLFLGVVFRFQTFDIQVFQTIGLLQ